MKKKAALLSLSILAGSGLAHALSYSSTLQFKVTKVRVNAKDFENYYKNAQEIIQNRVTSNEDKVTAPKEILNTALTKVAKAVEIPNADLFDPSLLRGKIPTRNPRQARIFVVDEESLLNGKIKPIVGAYILPINPEVNTNLIVKTSKEGIASFPYLLSESLRFFVRAPGYKMGMGYATFGNLTLVPLVSDSRYKTLITSLKLQIPDGQLAVYGKLSSVDFKGIKNSQIKFKTSSPQIFYSGPFLGGIPGYFISQFRNTDQTGSFIANGLSRTSHSLQILNQEQVIPGFDIDLSGIPEEFSFISLALQNGPSVNISSSLLDGDSFERPDCGLRAMLSNHLKPAVPDQDGNMWIETKLRPSVNNVVVGTENCEGYLPTYLSQPSHETLFPPTVGLFTADEIQDMLSDIHRSWDPSESIVLAHIYPQKEFKHRPIKEASVMIYGSDGKRAPAEVIYFDSDNHLDPRKLASDQHVQNFMVLGLDEGEYHFIYREGIKGPGIGIQVVRVKKGGVTQVDF